MNELFFQKPILNSPYSRPQKHWELDESGQPTQKIVESRRRAEFLTPIPKPKKQRGSKQDELAFNDQSTKEDRYHSSIINGVREQVDRWRQLSNPADWKVSPETARLLLHWRSHPFAGARPFFCQDVAANQKACGTRLRKEWPLERVAQVGDPASIIPNNTIGDAPEEFLASGVMLASMAGGMEEAEYREAVTRACERFFDVSNPDTKARDFLADLIGKL